MEIFYSPQFLRDYKMLSDDMKEKVKVKGKIFKIHPFAQRIRTHKLNGKWDGFWAFSVNFRYRIIFSFINKKAVKFHTIGPHSIYD